MARPWSQVENSKEFKSLPLEEQQAAQQAYFDEVIAPNVPEDQAETVKSEFFGSYPRLPISEQIETLPDLNFESKAQKWKDAYYAAENLGINEQDIDVESGADFLDRLDYSMSDTDKEIINKFTQKHPKGAMLRIGVEKGTRLMYKEDSTNENERWKFVEDYGVSPADIADLGGAAIPVATSVAVGLMTGGMSIPVQMLAYGGGYLAGEVTKEAFEEARGTQLEPYLPDEAKGIKFTDTSTARMLKESGEVALGTGVMGLAMKPINIATGRGAFARHPEVGYLLRDVKKAEQAGLKLEKMTVGQQAPEDMIINRLEAQARSTSKAAQHKTAEQLRSARQALEQAKQVKTTTYGAGQVLKKESERIYKAELNKLRNEIGRVSARKASKAGLEGMESWQKSYKNDISLAYRQLDDIAFDEKPIFNLSQRIGEKPSVRDVADDIKNLVLGRTEEGAINVAGTPEGQLKGVIDDILQLSDDQLDYNVLKQLRTRTGNVIENWPWDQNINAGQAKRLYQALTENIENPTTKAPNFVKSHTEASAKARAYYESLGSQSVQRMLRTENTGALVKEFAKPLSITDNVINEMSSKYYPKAKLLDFKSGVKQQIILNEKGAVQALDKFKYGDEKAWRFLVGKGEEKQLYKIAKQIDDLNQSNIATVVRDNTKAKDVVNELLLKDVGKSDIDFLTKNMSKRGRESARAAIYEDIIDKASTTIKNVQTIDKSKLNKVMEQYKKSGLWDSPVLLKNDRIKLNGLKSYLDLILYRGKDPGVSLEAAQAITDLKHPATFINGVHKLTVNSIMAKILMSDTASKILIGSGKNALKGDPLIITGLITKMLAEGTEPGKGESFIPESLPGYSEYRGTR